MTRMPLGGLAALMLLTGCQSWDETEALGLTRLQGRVFTQDGDGLARVRVPLQRLEGSYDKLLMRATLADDEGQTVYVQRIEGPDGLLRNFVSDLEVSQLRTGAVGDQIVNHLNWPVTSDAPALGSGQITIFAGAVNPNDRSLRVNAPIDVDILLAQDSDFASGELAINVHYADGVADDEHYVTSMEAAFDVMSEIYAGYGLTVTVTTQILDEGALPRPGFGAPETWEQVSASTDNLAIDMVIVDTIAGEGADTLGAAGSIPGGLLPAPNAGVILSASVNAGPDLQYTSGEVDRLGTTMAHEVGHMAGLFHPVELTYARWDALADTPECDSEGSCQANLGTNLMYPQALCDSSTCLDQYDLTDSQGGVVHRYTGVR